MGAAESRRFSELFGGRRETSDIVGIAKAACREGYAVLAVAPGGKNPLCTLTPRQAKAADQMAANAARAAGKAKWEKARHDCGRAHAITDPKDAERIFRRLLERHPDLNIGLEIGRSRMVVVDADTIDEVRSFAAYWAEREGVPEMASAAPTVRSPGKLGADGEWVHKDGGHFWFLLPEGVDFSEAAVSTTMPIGAHEAKAHVMFSDSLVLVPPSVREEGPYVMSSEPFPAPEWLIDDLMLHIDGFALRRARHLERVRDGSDPIDVWSTVTSWEEMLAGDGWTTSGRPDSCGCTVWTRPGDWSNPKSATAHEPGCTKWDTDGGHGFLHIWTFNPPEHIAAYIAATGNKSMSKLQYIAWRDFAGEMVEAMRALGIESNAEPAMSDDEIFAETSRQAEEIRQGKDSGVADQGMVSDGDSGSAHDADEEDITGGVAEGVAADSRAATDATDSANDEVDPFARLRAQFISAADLDKIPPLTPLVDGLLDLQTTTRVIGQSGHGKTFVMLDLAAHVATGMTWHGREVHKGLVAYVVAEGAAGFAKRVRAWEAHHGIELGDQLMVLPRPVQAANVSEWAVLVEVLRSMRPALVVIDTQARVTVGMEENSAKDMGLFVDRADRIKTATGACVALVHHMGHNGEHGRGSTAVYGALDAEISIAKEAKGRFAVMSSKQKDREDFDPIRLGLKKVDESAVLVSLDEGGPLLASLVDENSPPRDRIARLLWEHFNEGHGGTKAEIKKVVREKDVGPRGKPMDTATFYRAWSKLEGSAALVQDGAKYRLAISEAVALGLAEPRDDPSILSIQGEDVDH